MLTVEPNQIALAAGDKRKHLACEHLAHERLAIARVERGRPFRPPSRAAGLPTESRVMICPSLRT